MAEKKHAPTNRIWDFLVLWPFMFLFLLIFVFPFAGFLVSSALEAGNQPPEILLLLFPIFLLLYFATIVIIFVDYVYGVHRLYTQSSLDDNQKKTWLILIVLFNVITIPILHFVHLRK